MIHALLYLIKLQCKYTVTVIKKSRVVPRLYASILLNHFLSIPFKDRDIDQTSKELFVPVRMVPQLSERTPEIEAVLG